MTDRRNFLRCLLFVAPAASVVVEAASVAEKRAPRMIGQPICICGCYMFTTSDRLYGAPIEAKCTNRHCELFEKRFKVNAPPMEPV